METVVKMGQVLFGFCFFLFLFLLVFLLLSVLSNDRLVTHRQKP
uniref:Uncharacterized protein n=1 Tax=Rhizophora mucronata TaxID=61149 RepID=A0A2P2QTD6_RHIMU